MNKEKILYDWEYLLKQLEQIYQSKKDYVDSSYYDWKEAMLCDVDIAVAEFEKDLYPHIVDMMLDDGETSNE